jgi:chemotaxis signal transduction protein
MLNVKAKVATTKMMIFGVGDLYLGIDLASVQKVLNLPMIHKGHNPCLGITQVDNHPIVALDLYQTLYGQDSNTTKGYFILTQQGGEVTYGLMVAQLPTMIEIPLADFHPLPTTYRVRDTLRIASQMAQVQIDKTTVSATVFILDWACLNELAQQIDPMALQAEYEHLSGLLHHPVDLADVAVDLESDLESLTLPNDDPWLEPLPSLD